MRLNLYRFTAALKTQPVLPALESVLVDVTGYLLLAIGNVLVLSSMYRLGITGTYLGNIQRNFQRYFQKKNIDLGAGDYFGILMKERVTKFPFSMIENPMYSGSTLCFLGTALLYEVFAHVSNQAADLF